MFSIHSKTVEISAAYLQPMFTSAPSTATDVRVCVWDVRSYRPFAVTFDSSTVFVFGIDGSPANDVDCGMRAELCRINTNWKCFFFEFSYGFACGVSGRLLNTVYINKTSIGEAVVSYEHLELAKEITS